MSIKETFKAIMESAPVQEMGAEMDRLMVQGRAEVANAMFNGSAFVPYGDGQREAKASEPVQTLDDIMAQPPQVTPPEVQKDVEMEM